VTKQRGGKTAGKVSFIDRVKQKAKKAAGKPEPVSNKLTPPAAAATSSDSTAVTPPPTNSIMGISVSTAPATPATPATSSDDEDSQPDDDGPLEF